MNLDTLSAHGGHERIVLILHAPQKRHILEEKALLVFVRQALDLVSGPMDEDGFESVIFVVDTQSQGPPPSCRFPPYLFLNQTPFAMLGMGHDRVNQRPTTRPERPATP